MVPDTLAGPCPRFMHVPYSYKEKDFIIHRLLSISIQIQSRATRVRTTLETTRSPITGKFGFNATYPINAVLEVKSENGGLFWQRGKKKTTQSAASV